MEKIYYIVRNENDFKNGYIDYRIVVIDGIIISDNWDMNTIGKDFSSCYDKLLWS